MTEALDKTDHTAISPKDEAQLAVERIKEVREELFRESAMVCSLAMRFGDIPFGAADPPDEWIEEFGEEEARRRLRYVQAAQMNNKDAPVGIKVATSVLSGLLKSEAETHSRQNLNVVMVGLTANGDPVAQKEIVYQEVKVEE